MKIAFFGAGQIGGALIKGLLKSKFITADDLYVRGGKSGTAEKLQTELGFHLLRKETDLATSDIIIIATVPSVVKEIIKEIKEAKQKDAVILSIASSPALPVLQNALGTSTYIAHAIPNTPIQIQVGMTGVSFGQNVPAAKKELIFRLWQAVGAVIEVPEEKLATVGTVAGCSPAFVDIFMEALADAAVLNGLSRQEAYTIVPQMVAGSAQLMQQTHQHPGELKDQVCSPGGSTIQGVAALEEFGMRNALIQAVNRANQAH